MWSVPYSCPVYKVIKAPTSVPPMTAAMPMACDEVKPSDGDPKAALELWTAPDATEPAALVATVYTEPKTDVATPAPDSASVSASPPTLVTTVTAWPPTASSIRLSGC